jgi:large subunit ribosomal protein L21
MYAVIQTGGKQYRVAPGDELSVERLSGEVGESVTFSRVLMSSDGDKIRIGQPYLEDSKVVGRITRQGKHRKVVVFKFKRRKGYRRKRGHRQEFTLVKIENIEA